MTNLANLRARAAALVGTYHSDDNDDGFFDVLVGPGDFRCRLGEPEDRCWIRDGADAVQRLNDQSSIIRELIAALPAEQPLTVGDGCPGCAGALAGLVDTICGTCCAAVVEALSGPLTVGAALKSATVVEFVTPDGDVMQIGADGRARLWERTRDDPEWSDWGDYQTIDGDDALPCRLVSLALADLDPASRGGL